MKPQSIRQACVLVGGKGTRLGDLTRTVPKPLMPIGDDTVFLDIVLEQLARQDFDDIVLLAGYLGHTVRERYDGRQLGAARIRVVVEHQPLGTAGALATARGLLTPRFLLLNGDSFFDIDLRDFCARWNAAECEALLALRRVSDAARYGSVMVDGGRIVRFIEKNQAAGPAMINAGIYALHDHILDRIHSLPCSIETDVFPLLAEERRLCGVEYQGYFIDIGLPESLQQARRDLTLLTHRMRRLQRA